MPTPQDTISSTALTTITTMDSTLATSMEDTMVMDMDMTMAPMDITTSTTTGHTQASQFTRDMDNSYSLETMEVNVSCKILLELILFAR